MSGVKAIRALLAASPALTALAPAARIIIGTIPQGTPLPAISVAHVSTRWLPQVSGQSKYATERVQITVHAATYDQKQQVLQLARAAVPRRPGMVAGIAVESILREPDGPDFSDDSARIHMQTQDFKVAYIE